MANLVLNVLATTPDIVKKLNDGGMLSILPYEGEWDYYWCLDNWGPKWDIYDTKYIYDLCGESGYQAIAFLTANSPIYEFLDKSGIDYLYYTHTDLDDGGSAADINVDDEILQILLGGN